MTLPELAGPVAQTYSAYLYGLTVLTGVLCLLWDAPAFEQEGMRRDAALLRWIGWTYVVLGTLTFAAVQVLVRSA